MSVPNGEFGGVVVRRFTAAGLALEPGDEIPADTSKGWNIANRRALASTGMVRWHTQEKDASPRVGRPPKNKDNCR